jgi:sulfate adenylyltransferase/3'-phosphoadenosine 5'-phosphosulfate synthase
VTVWLTGLSGAGKSTIARRLVDDLRLGGQGVEILDGDMIRANLSKGLGFSKEDRDTNIRRIGFVANLLTRNGVIAVIAAISPYRAVRDELRAMIGDFIEVHVDCPLDVLVQRDVKGLYAKAIAGEISGFTGVSDPYEAPSAPEVALDTSAQSVNECVASILNALVSRGYLDRGRLLTFPAATASTSPNGNHRHLQNGDSNQNHAPQSIAAHGGSLEVRLAGPERAIELLREMSSLPQIELDSWSFADLELMAGGALSPLTGFMNEADLICVRDRMRLTNGLPWSLPVMLPVGGEVAATLKPGRRVALCRDGHPLAVLTVSETYSFDRQLLCGEVFGVSDPQHPGVAHVLGGPDHAVAGPVEIARLPVGDFAERRLTPLQTRALFAERGWQRIAGFQTRNPIHRAHEYLIKVALEQLDGLLIHPLVGATKGDDISAETRMRCYDVLMARYFPSTRVALAVFPGAMRYAGPREAVFHALIRQNYGCTHFIVGRDHAGVGSYYGTYAAQEIFDTFRPGEIGIQVLKLEQAFFCKGCDGMASSKTCPHAAEDRVTLSGTAVRNLLESGSELPGEFTRPEVARILIDSLRRT